MPPRSRPDALLVRRNLAGDLREARALILAGRVFCGTRRIDKAGVAIDENAELAVRRDARPWVSRGGVKLDHGLRRFAIDVAGCRALDIGASTGGFTDVLLERGARTVYAVDVGYGQLHWKLRTDSRVVVLDRTNARHLDAARIPEPVDVVVCDVSFTRLEAVLPPVLALAAPGARLCALVKPQFEVDRAEVGKGGIVADPSLHDAVCGRIGHWMSGQAGWRLLGIERSPITGAGGNVEFLLGAARDARTEPRNR